MKNRSHERRSFVPAMTVKQIVIDRPLVKVGCQLGEGPLYDPSRSILHFVDILAKRVYSLDTTTLTVNFVQYDEPVTCLALRTDGTGLACIAAHGFALLEPDSRLEYLAKPLTSEDQAIIRFNDGGCDEKGRFFGGTIYAKEAGIPGQLYRYDPHDGSCRVVDEGPFTDSNGLGWSPDGKIFYFTDSIANIIYAYDYDIEAGVLSNRRVFVDAMALGFPEKTYCDGLCVDDAGGVWSARWGGSRIVRFTPAGLVDLEVVFTSALNITSCCFGGPAGDQLYVTTAHCGANGGDATRQDLFSDSGDVFVVDFRGQYRGVKRHNFCA